MYIYKIIIKNFRNIDSFEWNPNKKINVLFGHNGCGKSNIAQALNLLFSTIGLIFRPSINLSD